MVCKFALIDGGEFPVGAMIETVPAMTNETREIRRQELMKEPVGGGPENTAYPEVHAQYHRTGVFPRFDNKGDTQFLRCCLRCSSHSLVQYLRDRYGYEA